MAWIESHQGLAQHPKTKKLARILDISIAQAVGHLHLLWWWAIDYAQDGDLSGYEAEDIAEAAAWDGDAGEFVEAMVAARGSSGLGFLEDNGKGLLIHDWYDYAGRIIEKRKANAERMREARAEHVQRTCKTRTGATVPTVPIPTIPTVPTPSSAPGDEDIAPAQEQARAAKPVKVTFDYDTGRFVNVTDELLQRWAEAYPAINVAVEVAKAGEWAAANPKNRKNNWQRFLTNWLARAQEKAPRARDPGSKQERYAGFMADEKAGEN